MIWTEQAECAGMNPRMFDDFGTPEAHATCARCPVRKHCLLDARATDARGVMRGGYVFPDFDGRPRKQRSRHLQVVS